MDQPCDDVDSLSDNLSPDIADATVESDDDVTGSHSVDIHCIVECVASESSSETTSTCVTDDVTQSTQLRVDTLHECDVRLATRCPFNELVPAALGCLGYGLDDCIAAEGTIHVRNWKPISCQSVADGPTATVGSILGGSLSSMVTLRIRLHRKVKSLTSDEIQDKMAAYIREHMLTGLDKNKGSIDKATLEGIVSREFISGLIPDSFRLAIARWYAERPSRSISEAGWRYPDVNETLQLDEWFRADPNPNPARIAEFVRLLNVAGQRRHVTFDYVAGWFAESRRRRRDGNMLQQLETTPATPINVINDDQLQRVILDSKKTSHIGELRIDCDDSSSAQYENGRKSNGTMTSLQRRRRSPPPIVRRVPVLPNRNAVYVLDAILPKLETQEIDHKMFRVDNDDDDDEQEMEIVCDSDDTADDERTVKDVVSTINGGKNRGSGRKGGEESSFQDEATDLRVRKIACRSDSGASVGSGGDDDRSPRNSPSDSGQPTTGASSIEDDHYQPQRSVMDRKSSTEDYYSGAVTKNNSGNATDDSSVYQSAMQLMPNRMLFPNGPTPTPSSHPLTSLYQHHQRALQLAAMSRAAALGLHLSGHGFAHSASAITGSSTGRPPSHGNGVSDDFRNYSSVGFDGKTNVMRNASTMSMLSDRSNSDLVSGLMSKSDCSPMGPGVGAGHGLGCGSGTTPSPSDPNGNNANKRSRVFIDPLTEIPKLERWFADDTHPSSYVIEKYTDELNRAPYRQRFPRLEPKNLQLWFKNHRAKMKRQREACSAAAAAAAAVVAAAASAANSPNGDRSRNHSIASCANGFGMIRQAAPPYIGDTIADKLHMQQQHMFGSRGTAGNVSDGAGRGGDNNSRSGPTAAEVMGMMSAAAAASGLGRNDDDDDRYDNEDGDSGDADKTNYSKRSSSDDDDSEPPQRDKKYFPAVSSAFTCSGAGGGKNGSGSELFSISGNNNYKDIHRDIIGGGGNYSAVGGRNGGGSVSGALDALVLRLQNGPFAAHSANKPEVH